MIRQLYLPALYLFSRLKLFISALHGYHLSTSLFTTVYRKAAALFNALFHTARLLTYTSMLYQHFNK